MVRVANGDLEEALDIYKKRFLRNTAPYLKRHEYFKPKSVHRNEKHQRELDRRRRHKRQNRQPSGSKPGWVWYELRPAPQQPKRKY